MPLQIRRGTNAERQNMTVPLAPGEPLYTTDEGFLYVGDGSTPGGILVAGYNDPNAQDAAAAIFTGNNLVHSSINFAYNTITNLITAAVDLSDYQGVIRANAFKGSVFADDGSTVGGTELVNAVDGSINLDGTVKGHIVPDVNVAYDLGSASFRFRDLYLSGSSIELGAASITATGSAVNLPAGSTVDGVAIGTGSGGGNNNDYSGNIIGEDSTIIVNTSNNQITATGGVFTDFLDDAGSNEIAVLKPFTIVGADLQSGHLVVRDTENGLVSAAEFETFSSTGTAGGFISFGSSRGDPVNRARLEDGDIIYSLTFLSLGVGGAVATSAFISGKVDGTTSDAIAPGALEFNVSDNLGNFLTALDIKSSGMTRILKGLSTDQHQDLQDTGTVDLTTVATAFSTAGPETASLAAGVKGQIKTFAAIDVTAGDMTITVTDPAWGGLGTMVFQSNGVGCTLQYIDNLWVCIGNNGVVFS